MHGCKCAANLLADVGRLTCTQAAAEDYLLECGPLDVIHPEAELSVVAVGAVNADDIRVADARQLPRLVQNAVSGTSTGNFGLEELEGHGMIQPRIMRVVNLAECPLADFSKQDEMTPLAETGAR